MSSALLTDRYELTMLQAALESGKAERECVFEVFTRNLPGGRRYGVLAGVGRVLAGIQDFQFQQAELEFLQQQKIVGPEALEFLANYKFDGQITGYREGEIYFPGSPVMTVTGSFASAVILETLILSILNYDSAVASAAARMHSAASGRTLVEMGARRAHEQAAVAAARAAYIAGFDSTSNLEAGRSFGIPTMGTSAHSFTLLHDSEREAFSAQISALGKKTTLLVDTYDIANAVKLGVELTDGELAAVRIDSGDLAQTAVQVRKQLDDLGAKETKIVVTSDLDEYTIAALGSAPVDRFGVGTSLVTGSGSPTAGFVYKLVSHKSGDDWIDVAKKSVGKSSPGGKKSARRLVENEVAKAELIGNPDQGRELQVELWRGAPNPDFLGNQGVENARTHHQAARAELPASGLRLSRGEAAIPSLYV